MELKNAPRSTIKQFKQPETEHTNKTEHKSIFRKDTNKFVEACLPAINILTNTLYMKKKNFTQICDNFN